ncbi:MAG: hypothetical protein H7Z37_05480, partial [Pyrinomonadaceae bacterium]|nr:hypothetical protein [Pyrinomonadaceae bacterium]
AILPDNKTANVQQFNVQFQQQLTNNTALSVGYVGTRGRNLSLYNNLNGRVLTNQSSVPCPISTRVRGEGSCYPGLGSVTVRDDDGESSYDSLQIQLERRFSKGWQYIASYTYSKTKDNGDGVFDRVAGGNLNYFESFTTSRLDFPNVLSFATVYELPFGRGRQFGTDIPKALDFIIGGLQFNAIFRAQSGSTFDVRRDGALVNLNGEPYANNNNNAPYLNRTAFTVASNGIGNLERNSLRSPSTYQLNLGLLKNFNFTERAKIQFRAEAFNALNKIQYSVPNTDIGNGNTFDGFGTLRNTVPFSNRQLQFGLRVQF